MRFSARLFQTLFLDKIKLRLKGGNGGNGNPKFGGKGGNGGSVILEAKNSVHLAEIIAAWPSFEIKAPNGLEPKRHCIIGASGEDVIIKVPTGIEVSLKSGQVLGTIDNPKDRMIVCRGGLGGGPLNRYLATTGDSASINLNLKLIADVGLIGFPNAGKSSLLNKISGMPAKIANYAFTTLKPQVATIKYPDQRLISIADLPGIIEGAHVNVGLGHHFLKHLERTKIHIFVIDLHGFRLNSKKLITSYRTPFETILLLNQELEKFNPLLIDKPSICVLNKVDKKEGSAIAECVMEQIKKGLNEEGIDKELCPVKMVSFEKVLSISAQSGQGLEELRDCIRDLLDKVALAKVEEDAEVDLDKDFKETMHSLV